MSPTFACSHAGSQELDIKTFFLIQALRSHRFSEIVANAEASTIQAKRDLEIIPDELDRLNSLYRTFESKVTFSS
jgi:hypothetical protein